MKAFSYIFRIISYKYSEAKIIKILFRPLHNLKNLLAELCRKVYEGQRVRNSKLLVIAI